MRMKNPFADEPGDEENAAGETPAHEARADETRESPGPEATEARAEDRTESAAEPESEAHAEPETKPRSGEDGGGGSRGEDSMTAAPSIGPNTVIDRQPPEERLDFDKISDTDAMGKDKRREVVGGTYGPTRTRVFATFATFIAVVAALAVGLYFLAKELDAPPADKPDEAPWSQAEAPQTPPRPIQ